MIRGKYILGNYDNGNYSVTILTDGTKIRKTHDPSATEFIPDFVESMDVKITNQCDMGCVMCHENSTPNGIHGDILSESFIDHLHPYTELAIGGGNPLSHPDLIPFLRKCKFLKLIPSITVNQYHFMKDIELIKKLVSEELIYGLGISVNNVSHEFIEAAKQFPNAVLHVINGIIHPVILEELANNDFKVLILGYKKFRRGKNFYDASSGVIDDLCKMLYDKLPEIINEKWFDVVSFDNLAIEQLEVKRLLPEDKWNQFYMGDDGNFTMYVDMVNKKYAMTSRSDETFDLLENPKEMFDHIRNISTNLNNK